MSANVRLATVIAADVTPATPRFAWEGRVPLGAVTVLAGPPGQGKTQLALGMCARATCGKLPGDLAGAVEALYVSAEDSISHTLTPRAIVAGADLDRLHFVQGININAQHGDEQRSGVEIPSDLPALDRWLADHYAGLVVLDPIVAMIPVALNTHRDQHVRRALAPLAEIAGRRNVAVIVVMHLNKSQEGDALNRLSGSIGFGGAARSVLLFASDPDDPAGEAGNRRILAHVKCNVAPKQPSIAYRIEPRTIRLDSGDVQTSIAVRAGHATASANDLLGNAVSGSEATARAEARTFLESELADGPVPTTGLRQRAEDAGMNWRTVERAKKQLGVKARKRGQAWVWELNHPITPPVGLDGVVGLEEMKADKADKAVTDLGLAVLQGGAA